MILWKVRIGNVRPASIRKFDLHNEECLMKILTVIANPIQNPFAMPFLTGSTRGSRRPGTPMK